MWQTCDRRERFFCCCFCSFIISAYIYNTTFWTVSSSVTFYSLWFTKRKMCFPDEAYGNNRITCITKQLLLFFLPGVALTCVVEQRVEPQRAGMSVLAIVLAIFTRPLANHLRVLQNYGFPFTLIPYMHFGSSSITNWNVCMLNVWKFQSNT